MQQTIEQAGDWQAIWARRGLLDTFIDAGRSFYNFFFRRFHRNYIGPKTRMLELGCGRASLTLSLCPEIGDLVGVDISDVAVAQATQWAKDHGIKNARFLVGDCTKLTLDERFDVVWSQGLIEHFEDSTAVAREHYRMLAPGGAALLSVPYTYSYHNFWYAVTRPKFLRRFWPWTGTEQRFFTKKELLELGKEITQHARVYTLQPLILGIIILELRRPHDHPLQ